MTAAILALTPLWTSAAFGAEYIYCDDGNHRLAFYGELASWGGKVEVNGETSWASCAYREGIDIPLEAINDWSIDVSGKNVRIFHGIGNVCSAGEFLLFNQLSRAILIVHSDFTAEKHQCE